jgi:hypothetical protein
MVLGLLLYCVGITYFPSLLFLFFSASCLLLLICSRPLVNLASYLVACNLLYYESTLVRSRALSRERAHSRNDVL